MKTMAWKTRFTKQFPATLPIMGAPMAGVSGGSLAVETCRAGALGFIAAGHLTTQSSLQKLEEQIQIFRAASTETTPLCIGWIGYSSFNQQNDGFKIFEEVLKKHNPSVVQFFAPSISIDKSTGKSNVEIAKEHNAKVLLQVRQKNLCQLVFLFPSLYQIPL